MITSGEVSMAHVCNGHRTSEVTQCSIVWLITCQQNGILQQKTSATKSASGKVTICQNGGDDSNCGQRHLGPEGKRQGTTIGEVMQSQSSGYNGDSEFHPNAVE